MTLPAATILIVDDEIQNRKLLETLLRPEGYFTLTAANGEEALASIAQRAPDLILLDVLMPGMDGCQVANTLKANPATSSIPIIMVTVQSDRGARLAGLDAGAEEFLTKPIDRAELWLRVRNLLRLKTLGDFFKNHGSILEQQVKEQLQAVRASEVSYRRLFEAAQDGILILDFDTGRIDDVNPYLVKLLGFSPGEMVGKTVGELNPFRDIESNQVMLERLQKDGYVRYDDLPLEARDGRCVAVEFVSNVYQADGKKMIQCNIRDITERRNAEKSLKELGAKYHTVFELSSDAIMLFSENGFFDCNLAALQLFACPTRADLINMHPAQLSPPIQPGGEDSMRLANQHIATANESGSKRFEWMHRRLDGTEFLAEVLLTAMKLNGKEVLQAVVRDITERKKVESRIAYLNRVYAVLSGINTLIVRAHDRDQLYTEACRIAVEQGGFRMSMLAIVDHLTMKVVPVASAGKDEELLTAIKTMLSSSEQAPNTMVACAIREKQAVVSNDSQSDPRVLIRDKYVESGVRSMAILPLIVSDKAVGVLALYAGEREFFHAEEMTLLTELARDIAFAIDHIGIEEKIARLSRIHAVKGGINALIVRVRNRQELFDGACRIAVEQGNFAMAWIGTLDLATQDVTPVAWAGENAEALTRVKSSARDGTPRGQGAVGRSIRERRPVFNNVIIGHGFGGPRHEEIQRLGFQSQITLPLYEDQAVVGVLTMYVKERDFFDEEELRLLTELAGNISFALANISRQTRLAKLSRIRAVTSEINALIVRVQDRQELFNEACRIAVEHGHFGMAWIGRFDPVARDITPIAWAGLETKEYLDKSGSNARGSMPLSQGSVSRAIRERRPVFINDLPAEAGPNNARRSEGLQRGFRSVISLPLIVGGAAVGNLSLLTRESNFFDSEEVKLLADLAGNISFSLDNIQRQQKLDKLARIRAISSEINASIIRIHDREALLRETCRIAVEHGKFELVWIGTVDAARQHIQMVAWNGFSPDVAHRVSWKSVLTAGGTLGEAIRTAKPTVRNDIETELSAGGMRAEALQLGCRSTACLPFVVDGNVVALISLFAAGKGFFDADELALLNEVAADVSFALQSIEKQKKLEYLSYYDVLTGLANRTLFIERVSQYMRSAASGGHKLVLFLIDLERFKNINDSLGRPAGDALLLQVAEWLTRKAGDASLLARVGADHFSAVLPEVKRDGDIAHLLEQWMEAFLEHPFRLNDAVFRIALKVGVALYPDDGADAETLFRNAEAALKKAKAGGERYLFHTQKMTETVAGELTLENQLRQALDNEEFVLHYQPKINLVSGKMTGVEALIRWNDPRSGLVPPGRFIPILEETGLIHEVGRWALRKAVEDYLRWRAAGLSVVRIAVNVSPLQLHNRSFVAEVREAIGIDAHAAAGLELEITESLIMEDVKHSIVTLQEIRALGVTIAIDDFGTGFSSLSYLAKLPVDTLKIDRSFVTDMTSGPEGLSLVSTIISLAHALKLKVVAEGVETEEQSRLLRLVNCDEMQGYLFSKPVPGEIFETRYLAPPPAGTAQRMELPVTTANVGPTRVIDTVR